MSEVSPTNGHPPEVAKPESTETLANDEANVPATPQPAKRKPKKKGPNYTQIHSKPLPLTTYPLPAFHPTNPISLLRLAYTYLTQLLAPPSSHPTERYIGYFSPESRAVHITDPKHVRALWEMGFFGKGTLSRSEPSWLDREKARVKAKRMGGGTAEEATNARREKRRLFKLERARVEAEKIERQRLVEEGKLDASMLDAAFSDTNSAPETTLIETLAQPLPGPQDPGLPDTLTDAALLAEAEDEEPDIENQEHLQLTMEEAFFLSYGLGVLNVRLADGREPHTKKDLIEAFANHGFFPPRQLDHKILPDDPFMLSYVTYHHFRSLGWVVRPGVKFSVDYLLYYRGPVFSHAEFAVMIMPSYSDAFWSTDEGQKQRRIKEQKDWWWLHCINRVQSQVLKSLVLVYVDVPAPSVVGEEMDIGNLLKQYKVREFIIKRWIANRSRD